MPSERCSEGNFYRFLLTLSQQLQDLLGVGGSALAHLIAAAIPPKKLRFFGDPDAIRFCPNESVKIIRRTTGGVVLRLCY